MTEWEMIVQQLEDEKERSYANITKYGEEIGKDLDDCDWFYCGLARAIEIVRGGMAQMRLIDADKMIKDLTERYEDNLGRDVILKLIGEQPEAYNAEKVVEELERQEEIARDLKYDRFFSGQERAYIKAREIVKAGGQNE